MGTSTATWCSRATSATAMSCCGSDSALALGTSTVRHTAWATRRPRSSPTRRRSKDVSGTSRASYQLVFLDIERLTVPTELPHFVVARTQIVYNAHGNDAQDQVVEEGRDVLRHP